MIHPKIRSEFCVRADRATPSNKDDGDPHQQDEQTDGPKADSAMAIEAWDFLNPRAHQSIQAPCESPAV